MSKLPENSVDGWPSDGEIETRARALFRSACEETDSYHALRLGLARRRALGAHGRRAPTLWAPLAGAAACCVLVAGVLWMHPGPLAPQANSHVAASAVASGEPEAGDAAPEIGSTQMELVENLEFYRWLATQPGVASAAQGGGR